jgi:hypothetical protein
MPVEHEFSPDDDIMKFISAHKDGVTSDQLSKHIASTWPAKQKPQMHATLTWLHLEGMIKNSGDKIVASADFDNPEVLDV